MANLVKTKQQRTLKRGGLLFALVCFLVLCAVMLSGAANFLNSEEAYFYDDFSDNLMKGDVRFMREFGMQGPLPRYVGPGMEFSGREPFTGSGQVAQFLQGDESIPADEYAYYTSNLTIQRYFYVFVSLLWSGGISGLYAFLAVANTVLLAAALAGVLWWLRGIVGTAAATVVLLATAFLSPVLLNFSTNLYWTPYTWFVPLLGAAFVVARKAKAKTNAAWYRLAFFVALFTCLFKQLHCFEHVSGVMIAMMLPYICWLVQEVPLKKWKTWLKTLLWPALGAVASFVLAMGAKAVVLAAAWYPEKQQGQSVWQLIVGNILQRTGGADYAAELAAQGYDVTLWGVLQAMFGADAIVLRTRFAVSFGVVVALLAVATVAALVWQARAKWQNKNVIAVFAAAWVAFVAPLFWFVVGRLHVVDHIKIDLVAWYIPFIPIAYAALAFLLVRVFCAVARRFIKKENPA